MLQVLGNNKITGPLPAWSGGFKKLQLLGLSTNSLSGGLPSGWSFPVLSTLEVRNLMLVSHDFTRLQTHGCQGSPLSHFKPQMPHSTWHSLTFPRWHNFLCTVMDKRLLCGVQLNINNHTGCLPSIQHASEIKFGGCGLQLSVHDLTCGLPAVPAEMQQRNAELACHKLNVLCGVQLYSNNLTGCLPSTHTAHQ